MTKRKNMTAGERQVTLEKRVEQLEMATRMTQMLLQQIGNSISPMATDIRELASRQRENQYLFLAAQELLSINKDALNKKAEELQVKDFNDLSAKEDQEKGYLETDLVTEDSLVIITTEADSNSILRSKLELSEIRFPEFKESLVGKAPGHTFETDLNGVKHKVTLLGVRSKPQEIVNEAQPT